MRSESTVTVTIPAMPRRPDKAGRPWAEVVYDLLLWVLGIVSALVSGWSITTLLHTDGSMPWGFAWLGVGVYDLLAFMSGLMVYIRRREPHRAVGPQLLLFAALAGSAYVNYVHGLRLGGTLVALLLGAAPVTFEIAFAMRHNVMSLTTAILFPKRMWGRYTEGVFVNLYTGSLPVTGSGTVDTVPEVPDARVPRAVPEQVDVPSPSALPEHGSLSVPEPAEPELTRTVPVFRADGGMNATSRRKLAVVPEPVDVPEVPARVPASGRAIVPPERRVAELAEALRRGEEPTGADVGRLYHISDRAGRTDLKRARALIEGDA
jgi:hypothetical protein